MMRSEPRRFRRPCGGCGKQTCGKAATSRNDPFFENAVPWEADYGHGELNQTYEAVCWACWYDLMGLDFSSRSKVYGMVGWP